MNKVMNVTEVENKNTVFHASPTTEAATYVKPTIEVIEMEMEGAILSGSDSVNANNSTTVDNFDDGGCYERE